MMQNCKVCNSFFQRVYNSVRFVRYPTTVFDRYLEELGAEGCFENVIFTHATLV
jgi:hypothetical protein